MSDSFTATELMIADTEKRHREYRRREAQIPEELWIAANDDHVIKMCIDQYIRGEGNYLLFLENLAIVQYKKNKGLQDQLFKFSSRATVIFPDAYKI